MQDPVPSIQHLVPAFGLRDCYNDRIRFDEAIRMECGAGVYMMRFIWEIPVLLLRVPLLGGRALCKAIRKTRGVASMSAIVIPPGDEGMQGPVYDRILQMWQLQESLLHTYQTIFLTFHAILIAATLAFEDQQILSLSRLTMTLGLFTAFIWLYLVWDRALAASFFPCALDELESGRKITAELRDAFVHYRRTIGGLRPTRSVLANLCRTQFRGLARTLLGSIPLLFIAIWVCIICMRWHV